MNCEYCEKYISKNRFCSQSCATKYQHQQQRVSQRCKYCSKYAKGDYCNESCVAKQIWLINRCCDHCGEKIPEEKNKEIKFCNRSCAAKHNNRLFPKRKARPRPDCLHCDKGPLKRSAKKYCSTLCQNQYEWAQRVAEFDKAKEIMGLVLSTGRAKPTNRIAKRYLKQKRGVACEICKDTEHNFGGTVVPMPLILDHIDGNSDNWKLSNLRLVCGRCDMLLPTYKAKNRGNGRHYRRQRYAQGKSY